MARKSNTKIDYQQLSSDMQSNAKQIFEEKRQESQPAAPVNEVSNPEPQETPKPVGRKKGTNSKIKRENGICLYLEDRHREMIEDVVYNNRIKTQQRIVQTAIEEFFRNYYVDGKLNEAGVELIRAYEESIKA